MGGLLSIVGMTWPAVGDEELDSCLEEAKLRDKTVAITSALLLTVASHLL